MLKALSKVKKPIYQTTIQVTKNNEIIDHNVSVTAKELAITIKYMNKIKEHSSKDMNHIKKTFLKIPSDCDLSNEKVMPIITKIGNAIANKKFTQKDFK